LKRFESHILDELNIKQLQLVSNLEEYVTYEVKCNYKSIGPKFGAEVKTVTKLLAEQSPESITRAVAAGKDVVLKTDDKSWQLQSEDIIVERRFPETLAVSDHTEPALLLDIEITEPLRREGLARDVVRHVQQIRKEIELEIQDHITVNFRTEDETVRQAIAEHYEYICRETLCNKLAPSEHTSSEGTKDVKIGGVVLSLQVTKAT